MSDARVHLRWEGRGLVFRGGPEGGPEVQVDGDAGEAPAPMQQLLLSLAGCMAIDVLMILEKSRVPVASLAVEVEGTRVDDHPRRFDAVTLVYVVEGPGERDRAKLERAVALSRDTYCSVLHTLRPDLELQVRIELR